MSPPLSDNQGSSGTYGRKLHFVAILTACAVFPLIFVGAGVTSKDAGMAYPSGFTSNGYFLLNPPGWWDNENTRWEHGHRLLGRAVGVLAIVLAMGCWRYGGTIRTLGICNLLAIITQGLLGAFRVNEVSTALAMIHGVIGPMCFCLACSVALVTGRTWRMAASGRLPWSSDSPTLRSGRSCPPPQLETDHLSVETNGSPAYLYRLCLIGAISAFVQLVSGAGLRHFGPATMLLIHVLGAIVSTFLLGWMAMSVLGRRACGEQQSGEGRPAGRHPLTWLGRAMAVLLVLQLMLGGTAFTVTLMGGRWSPFVQWAVPSAHVAVGAVLLACAVLVTMITYHPCRTTVELGGGAAAAQPITA